MPPSHSGRASGYTADLIILKRLVPGVVFLAVATGLVSCSNLESTGTATSPSTGNLAGLQGVVMDAKRRPLSDVLVSIGGIGMTTGFDGRYAFSGLPAGDRLLTGRRQGLVNFSAVVALAGSRTLDISMKPSEMMLFAGNSSGTWTTVTFDRTGDVTMSLALNTVTEAVEVAVDVYGNLVGDYDPPADVFLGVLTNAGGIRIAHASPVYGNAVVDLFSDGRIAGSVTQVPIGTATRFDFTGTMSATTTSVNYTITFSDRAPATGIAILARRLP